VVGFLAKDQINTGCEIKGWAVTSCQWFELKSKN